MKTAIIVFALMGVALASVVKRQVALLPTYPQPPQPPTYPIQPQPPPRPTPTTHTVQTYSLPDGAELIVGPIKSTFSCIDKIYGYYADTDNNCQLFHVCVPFVDEENNQFPITYNFFCGNQTVFDQANLVCTHPADATPCSEATLLYSVNENFGRTDRPLVRA